MGFKLKAQKIEIYQEIQNAAVNSVCSVLVFVATSVDALCALKILTTLFRHDFIPFKVIPVAGYGDISAANEELIQGKDDVKLIRTIIMLGCGGLIDLSEFLSLSPEMTVYVFDHHRPYSLQNIFNNSQVIIADDGFIEANESDLKQALLAAQDDDQEDEEDASDEDDFNSVSEEDSEFDSDGENSERNLEESGEFSRTQKKRSSATFRKMCKEKFMEYFSGSWFGSSIASAFYELSDEKTRANNDFLWFAIIGVTDLYLQNRCSLSSYQLEVGGLRSAQERLNNNVVQKSRAELSSENGGNISTAISSEDDFKFVLLRHWNLFNSMLHSNFIMARFNVWRERGRKTLDLLLAKMGIPLSQCRADYGMMDLEYREMISIQLDKYAEEYGIKDVTFPSFVRDFGFVLKISAADAVCALKALLESPSSVTLESTDFQASSEPSGFSWKKNFFFAFDSLDGKNVSMLKEGICLSIKQHQILFREACTIMSHRLIRFCRGLRYVVIKNGTDLDWLLSVGSLERLSRYLVIATRSMQKSSLPLIVAVFNAARDSYLLLASNGESLSENKLSRKNSFGTIFRQAAQMINARIKHDGFEASAIEIKSNDLKSFLQTLQAICSAKS